MTIPATLSAKRVSERRTALLLFAWWSAWLTSAPAVAQVERLADGACLCRAGAPPADVPTVLVERGVLAERIAGYNPDKALILFQRLTR